MSLGESQVPAGQAGLWGLQVSPGPQVGRAQRQRRGRAAVSGTGTTVCTQAVAPAERLLWPGQASPSAPQLLAFSPGSGCTLHIS